MSAGPRRSIVFSIGLGAGLIAVILLLYIGWVLLNWRTGILFFFGILLVTVIMTGVVEYHVSGARGAAQWTARRVR